jgi:hypothetical protein
MNLYVGIIQAISVFILRHENFYRKFIQIVASSTGHHAAIRLPQTLDGPQKEESGIAAAL